MAKNKDDEFNFEWDDDSSFDSKLDNFDGDVSEYHSDDIKSAEKDRNPVAEKLKSITPTINAAGSAVIAGAGKGIGRAIEDDMPEVYQAYQQGTHVLSEAHIARQEISDKFRPWWNDTKRAVRRLSQQLEGQMPFGLDKKILKLVGEEDRDQQYKQPSKESLRQEQMNSNISQIFELQMQKSMEQQKDAVLNRTYDRRVDAIRHKESAGFLAKIAESSVFHQAFTNSVFTAYLKKDLELKYKQFYATEDILGVMTNHAKAVDTKLDAVIKNTALPEADKIYMGERIIGRAKENIANKFNDKLNNYFGKMRENLVNKFKDAIDWAELIPEMFNMQAEMLETANDEDMQGFGGSSGFGEDSVFTKKGLMKLGFGKIGDFFGRRILRKLTSKLPQETMESLKYYFGGGQNGLALLVDDLARGRLKGLPSGLRDILRSIAPRLNDTTQTVVNESWQTLHNGGKITNKFIQAVEEVIPGYLKMQTRYLEILATGRDSGLLEWDPRKHTFRTQQELVDAFARSASIDGEKNATLRVQHGAADTTQLIQHVADSYGSNKVVIKDKLLKAQRTSTRDIELFKVNLAHSEDYWRIDENILSELNTIATANDENKIQETNLWKAGMFKGIKSPVNVAGFWLDILADRTRDGLVPNKVAIDHLNAIIVKERINYSGRHRAMLEQIVKDTGHYFLLDKFSKQDSNGNYIVDESAILRQQMNTKASGSELMQKLTPEQLKFYNQTFLDIKEEEKNKKNWFGKWVKGLKEKLSKFDLTEFTDDIFKGGFISMYKKFNGENSDEAAEKKWTEILKDVDEIKKFFVNNYEKLSSEVKKAWDKFKIKTFDEALTVLGNKVDSSFHNLRNKLMYIDDDGEKKLRDISELTEEEWYDWFISIQNIESVLETFDGKSALSQVLRSVLPDHIQALLIAARNDKNLIKNMRLTANQYSGTDAESVNKRMQINKEAARKAIAKANKAITARMTSRIGSTTKSNMSDDDYKALSEANIKMHKDEYSQMIKVDTDKLNENSQIDISKEQLKILKNIDNQLGLFYHAFIDPAFKHGELLAFNKSKGKIEGDQGNYALNAEISKWLNILNNPTMRGWHKFAKEQLKQNGFANEDAAKEWLNDRNDTLKDTRSRLDYHRHYNTGAIDITTGAVLQSNAELDKLTSDEALKKNYGENINITDELRYQERYNAQRKMLRKHYIQLLKTRYIKDNSNNPIYTYFANKIISEESTLLSNINATISDEDIYIAVVYFILNADSDDSRRSVIRYLKLLLVRDETLTSSIKQEDIRIGVIQKFLPINTGNILQYALNYVKDVEAHGNTSANAITTHMKNIVNIDINNSSYDNILAMRADKEKELDKLNKDIADIYSDEDDVYISEEDRRKRDELLISRDATKVGLNTINTAIRDLENSRMRRISKDKTGVYADSHSSFISELIGKDNLNYGEAIKYIENIGRSPLRKQNTDNKLISNSQNAEMTAVIQAVDAIKTNFSTEEDIAINGPATLKSMLTGIYQYIKQTNKTPNDRDINDIYRAIIHTASSNNKRKYASGESYDLNEHMQLDDAAVKYIEKVMSKPGGPTAAEFKKIQKLHAEALRRFVTRNPNMRNAAAEQYLNNGIPVLQWDTNKLSSLSPYDQQVGKMLFGDFYKRGNRYLNAGGRAHGTSIKGKNANAVIELGYDTPVNFDTLFTLDHESRHILDKRAQPGMYNLSKYAGREHIGVGAPWEHYANLGAIKSQIERGNVDQLIKMMQYLNKTANDNTNDNRYLAKQIRRMLHKAGVDTSAYSPTRKYAKGGNIALAYSKQLLEDKKLDDELRKKYKYGKYFDEKYSSADLIRIRSSLSPQEQQIFDAECADFNNNWLPRFINRLKPFRSSRWEKHTNGIPVIDANKINQNIEFSPWDREYIDTLLNALTRSSAAADPYSKIIWARSDNQNKLIKGVLLHEASHVIDKDALPTANISIQDAHSGKGARFEKRADWNAVKRLLAAGDIKGARGFINWLQRVAKEEKNDPHRRITDVGWRANLLIKAAKRYGYDLNQGLKYKKFAKGDNISFDLPIDQYGGYVDQPTEILGGTGIAGEAGGETILPHKFNERFKELIYRCLRDTVGENIARRVLGMLNPSETTEDKLGILLSDNDKAKFASGGSTASANANVQTDTDTTNKKEEYTRQHPTDTIKNILLNIMESNEAIYSKLGDGLLVVDLASALDKFKNSELMNKLKGLKISERIKNFIFGTDDEHKGLIGNVLGLGKRITFGVVNNAASFGRHLVLGSKVCDVFLKSDIEGQVHGDKKISAAELENGTIFSDAKCTKPIYSVADIYPPAYRKKIDENGKTIVEEAITEEEAKPGLVDVDGNPLTYFGGKVGRFLHNIAMKPINAIFSKSALEKVSNIGSSISSGIRHGFDGFFGAYCDVYSARNPEKMLVSGTSIKEGRLVRIPKEGAEPKVVPTVFDIDSECWIMIDDPNDATKRILGDKVIYAEDITAGLQHRDGTPIESSKLSLAMSKLRRLAGTVGGALATLTGGAFGIAGKSIQFVWEHGAKAAGWLKDRVVDAFTSKDPYIDVCIVKDGKLEVVITGEDLKTNKATMKYCFRDDKGSYKPVLSAYGIDSPVYTMVGADGKTLEQPKCVIKKEDIENGVFDTNGNRLTRWAGRSLAGKIGAAALGAVKFGWRAIKGIGKGIWNVGATVVGKLGSLLGEGGAAVTGIITNAWNSTLDLFRNTIVSRRDLQEIVGDRLLDIYGLLYKYMPRKKYDPNDKDGDGDIDGSWEDYEQKRKAREAKREQERLNQWYKDHPNAERNDDNVSFLSKLKNAFFSGFGNKDGESSSGFLDWVLGALGIKSFFPGKGAAATTAAGAGKAGWLKRLFSPIAKLFAKPHIVDGKLESGKLYKFGKGIKEFFTGNKLTGKTGIIDKAKDKLASAGNWFKGLFGKKGAAETAEEFHARVAAQRAATRQAILASSTSRAATGATSAASRSVFTKLLGSLGPKVAARVAAIASSNAAPIIGQIASIGMTIWSVYEIGKWLITDSPKTKNMRSIRCKGYGVNSKYWEAIIDLETDTFEEFLDGNTNGVDRDRLTKFGYKVDFLDLSNPDSEKLEFLTTWYRKRFMPAYNFYLGCMRTVGVEFEDDPPKDDNIPDEKYAVFVTEFTKHIDKFSSGPTKIFRLDNNAYTTWLANKHEKERDEGLLSSKYNDNNLADKSISKLIDNPLDNLGYAWNEFRHGNVLNALWYAGKAVVYAPAYAYAKTVDVVWKNITSYFNIGLHGDQRSNNEKAWDEVRFKLYGLNKDDVSKEEYSRITKVIKDFEINQIHVIDGEQQVLDDELKDLARELFPAKIRQEVKNRLMLTNDFTDNVSDDLSSEARSFVFSWYKRIFVPIFTAYARVVRAACGDKPGDNISIDSIPEENRLPLLKEFERQSNRFLATNIDTEILRLSSKGFYDFLVMRSDEDKAELAKDTQGLLTEEETTFSDKLSRNLNKAGKNFSDAWNALVKEKNVVKAVDRTLKGIGNTVIGVFKSIGTSIGESIADFLHGSKNEHAWEERFIDYGFMDREGSSDIFTNSNISAMNEFEKEAGRILLEDNTSKPDDKFFISLAFNCKYIEKCCASLFGVALNSLAGAHQAMFAMMTGKLSLSMVKTTLINEITSKLAEDKNKEQQVKDVSQKISDMLNYLDFWYTFRFKPVFGTFINVVSQYGVDAANIDVDDIPTESRKEALEQYRKMVSSVLKKNNIRRYSLSPEGLAIYLDELYAYREDIKDGRVDNKYNPLAAYYKEKEETYKNEVINAVVANAFGLSKEDKSHVANSLAKASTEIDTELNDVSLMATISAKDALKDLGIDSLIDINYTRAEATIVGKLMELTTGYNNYDKLGVGSGFIWDDKLGKVFTDFMEDAHKYLYKGGSAEDLHEALTKFMNIYLKSKVFSPGSTQDVNTLDSIMSSNYPYVAASNATFKYFANWFSHRFIPYYTYYVTLVNKANKVDDKDEPALGKLTSTHRRYVLMKLMGAEKKNLIPNKAKALKLTQQDMENFYKRENAIAEQRTQTGARKRQSRAVLQQQVDEIRKRYEEKRDKAYTESNNTESSRTETNNVSTIKAVDGVATGATVGGRYARNKGTSLSTKDRQYVWDFLISQLGLTEPQAAAVMGNMMQESGLSCDVVNGIGATGICQWLGNRLYGGNGYVGLIPFAKANGLDYMSVEAQMKYLQWELTHNKYERDRFDAFVRSVPTDQDNIDKTIAQCAVGFRKGYERCGENEANDTKRISYAKAIYNTFSSDKAIPKYTNYSESNVESMQGSDSSVEETSFPSYIKQYSNSVVPSTTPSDRTMGVSGGNSSVPSHIARYGNISEMTAKACKSLTVNSREKSIGRCARYVANALQAAGYKFNRQPSAYMYHTNGILSGMGFECIGRNNPQPQPGDVCVINRFNGHPHGHICMFNGQQWISDFRQRTPVPYKAGAPGGLWYYRPSGNTSADSNGEFITNSESASSSQDSIVTSTYNSTKANDALVYSNAVDTIRDSLPSENAEQTPSYTYTNMTGEGDNKHILTQNAMQSSIAGANNGSAPIVAELQLISKILSEFRGDVVGFINTLLTGTSSSGKTEQSRSIGLNNNKPGSITTNNVDENTIKEIGDKLLTYVSGIISSTTKSSMAASRQHTSNTLANTYPLSSSKTR